MSPDTELRELGLRVPEIEESRWPRRLRSPLGPLRRLRAWFWHHRQSLPLVGLLLLTVGVVQAWGMTRSPAPVDDEGTYVAQAWAVQTQHRLAHYTYWYDHPPFGWIQLSLWTWITDAFHRVSHAVFAGREAMLLAGLISAGLVFVISRRLGLPRWAAAIAVLAFGLSPLAVSMHRMVYLDNIAVPWVLAAFALALSPRRSLWAAAASGLCFAAAVLSKETFLLLLPALVWQLWQHCDRRTRAFCLTALASVLALALTVYPLYALLKGELLPGRGHVSLLNAVGFQLFSRASSGAVLGANTPAHHTVAGWLAIDSWLFYAGLVLLPFGFVVRRTRPVAAALTIQFLMLVRGGYLPGPFVIGMLPFAALLIAGLVGAAWGGTEGWRSITTVGRRLAVAAAIGLALVLVLPHWWQGDRAQMTQPASASWAAAEGWVERNVPRDQRLIVDDTMWVDLVDHGFPKQLGVVWFYKLDSSNNLDPSVARRLPGGWRQFGYIISTPNMRSSVQDMPNGLVPVREALANSTVAAKFGAGNDLVEVRQINPQATP